MKSPAHTFLLCVAISAVPAYGNPEFEVSIGLNTSNVDSVAMAPGTQSNLHSDFAGIGPRATFGISWSDRAAMEVGWSRFGTVSGVVIFPHVPPPGSSETGLDRHVPAKQSGSALWAAYTPAWRHGPFQLSAKFGVAQVRRATEVLDNPPTDYRARDTGFLLGAAATHELNERIAVGLAFEQLGSAASQMGLTLSLRF